jgi:predicted RNA-binding Zn-ribbon protein involved in translation (DUF1610 family)
MPENKPMSGKTDDKIKCPSCGKEINRQDMERHNREHQNR